MNKTASIAYLDLQGPNARKFSLSEAVTRSIFLPDYMNRNPNSIQFVNNLLRRIHLHRICVSHGTSNSFPFPLGIKIQGIPASEYTIDGDSFNYIIPAKFSVLHETCIFESVGDAGLMQTWEEDFAKWNTDNLETLCAMIVPESDVVMVHLEHPVVQLLDKKYEEFNTLPPTEQPNTTPNWRQIHRAVFDRACAWLRDNILSKSSKTFDMTQINIYFDKIDNSKFTLLPPSFFVDIPIKGTEDVCEMTEIKSKFSNLTIQRPFSLDIKLKFYYRLPTM
jgi:hypothetical protein